MQLLIFLSGKYSTITERPPKKSIIRGKEIIGKYPEYRISECEKINLSIDKKEHIRTTEYNGNVYCAEVPTYHTLVTRRNRKILISGNCTGFAGVAAVDTQRKKEDN